MSNNPGASGEPQIGAFGNNVYVIWDDTDPSPTILTAILKKSSDSGSTFGNEKIIAPNGKLPLVDVSSGNKCIYYGHRRHQEK